jgi:hypothetical protein
MQIGKYTVRESTTPGKVTIFIVNGGEVEGGEFNKKELEAAIDDFYKKNF